jgi:transcription initiation factor TFIIIB Brf1 subunit/transcription initiation factor TFIIB
MQCAKCESQSVIEDTKNGYMVCTRCGAVTNEQLMIDSHMKQEPEQCSAKRSTRLPNNISKLLRWNAVKADASDAELHTICDRFLSMSPGTIQLAQQIYSDVRERKATSLRGNFKRAVMACCSICAGKISGCNKSQKMVCEAFEVPTRTLTSAMKMLRTELVGKDYYKRAFRSLNPKDVLAMHYTAGVDRRTRSRLLREAAGLQEKVRESGKFQGRSPATIAAGILKIMMKDTMDFVEVSEACGISLSTAESIYQELVQELQ